MTPRTVTQNDLSKAYCDPSNSQSLNVCSFVHFGLGSFDCASAKENLEPFTHHFITNSEHLSFTVPFISENAEMTGVAC